MPRDTKILHLVGVVYLELCDALIKIALQLTSKISKGDLSNTVPLPYICEKAKTNLANAKKLLEHEDPDGPEAGGLIAGANQLALSLAQFQ